MKIIAMEHTKSETIYANVKCSDVENISNKMKGISVPLGRKPALPPKPPKQLDVTNLKQKRFMHNACAAIFDRKSPPNKKDPAEMSLFEKKQLFEKKNKAITLISKTPLVISTSSKQNCTRNNEDQIMAPLISTTSTVETSISKKIFIIIYIQ